MKSEESNFNWRPFAYVIMPFFVASVYNDLINSAIVDKEYWIFTTTVVFAVAGVAGVTLALRKKFRSTLH